MTTSKDLLQHTCKEIAEQITRLERECEVYREALEKWDVFEAECIKRDGPYAGKEINCLIVGTREALKQGEKIRGEK